MYRAAGVAFAWIGAVSGPLFFVTWIIYGQVEHLIASCVLFAATLLAIVDGISSVRRRGPWSDTLAYLVLPSALLMFGIALAVHIAQ